MIFSSRVLQPQVLPPQLMTIARAIPPPSYTGDTKRHVDSIAKYCTCNSIGQSVYKKWQIRTWQIEFLSWSKRALLSQAPPNRSQGEPKRAKIGTLGQEPRPRAHNDFSDSDVNYLGDIQNIAEINSTIQGSIWSCLLSQWQQKLFYILNNIFMPY